jgi:hypothetical protein
MEKGFSKKFDIIKRCKNYWPTVIHRKTIPANPPIRSTENSALIFKELEYVVSEEAERLYLWTDIRIRKYKKFNLIFDNRIKNDLLKFLGYNSSVEIKNIKITETAPQDIIL